MMYLWLVAVVTTTIYWTLKKKNGEFISLFFWYPILPNAFGYRMGDFPLISVNRILLVYVFIVYCYKNNGRLRISLKVLKRNKIFSFLLLILFVVLLVNYIQGYANINDFISFFIEFIFVILLLSSFFRTKGSIELAIRYIGYAAMLMYIIGIVEFVLRRSLADSLYIGYPPIVLAERLGVRRASVTMNAITYGFYCAFTFPLIYYMFKSTKKILYAVMMVLCIVSTMCSITRSAILVVALEVIFFILFDKNNLKSLQIICFLILACLGATIFIVVFNKDIFNQIVKIAEATIHTFSTNKKYSSVEINNSDVINSRFYQYSVAIWLVKTGHLLTGYGPDALTTDRLYYYTMEGKWWHARIGDTAYAIMLGTGGILTMLVYILFYCGLLKKSFKMLPNMNYRNIFILLSGLFLICNLLSVFYQDNLAIVYYALILAGTGTGMRLNRIDTGFTEKI